MGLCSHLTIAILLSSLIFHALADNATNATFDVIWGSTEISFSFQKQVTLPINFDPTYGKMNVTSRLDQSVFVHYVNNKALQEAVANLSLSTSGPYWTARLHCHGRGGFWRHRWAALQIEDILDAKNNTNLALLMPILVIDRCPTWYYAHHVQFGICRNGDSKECLLLKEERGFIGEYVQHV